MAEQGNRQARSQDRQGKGRKQRVPLGTPRSKMAVEGKDPNFTYRWVNDQGGRIQQAEQASYEFVKAGDVTVGSGVDRNSETGDQVSQIVGTKEDGSPMRAYLMRIKREFYEEDQNAKQEEVDAKDAAIQSGSVSGQPGQDGRYVSNINYET